MTDASAYLIQNRMSASQRDALMQELFGRNPGIGLSFMRLTIGASDFSLRHYSYDDHPSGDNNCCNDNDCPGDNGDYIATTITAGHQRPRRKHD